MTTLAAVIALGVAGFDPLGALTLIAAVTAGARRAAIAALTLVTLGGTWLLCVVGSSTVGALLRGLVHRLDVVPREVWGWVALVVGLALIGWGVWRLMRREPPTPEHHPRTRGTGVGTLAAGGVVVALSVLLDPAFYGLVAVSSGHHLGARLLHAGIWSILSHWLLIVLALATLTGGYARVHAAMEALRARWAPRLTSALSILLVVGGAAVAVDGVLRLTHHAAI